MSIIDFTTIEGKESQSMTIFGKKHIFWRLQQKSRSYVNNSVLIEIGGHKKNPMSNAVSIFLGHWTQSKNMKVLNFVTSCY